MSRFCLCLERSATRGTDGGHSRLTTGAPHVRTVSPVTGKRTAADLFGALWGALGVFAVGFFGSEILFGPGADGIALEATLLPAIAAAVGAFFYFLATASGEEAA